MKKLFNRKWPGFALCAAMSSTIFGFEFTHTPNAAISGYNNKHLTDVTVEQCKHSCNTESAFTCLSFDYYKSQKACDLSSASAATVGGLKTDYSGNPYDHYSKNINEPNYAVRGTILDRNTIPVEYDTLQFDMSDAALSGFNPVTTEEASYPVAHVQKVLRFPQRDEYGDKVYFSFSSSASHGGWVWIVETNPGLYGPNGNDSLIDTNQIINGFAGKVVWWRRTDAINIQNEGWGCNHPGNMSVHENGTFAIACQNWKEEITTVKIGNNDAPDYIAFYDVRNIHQSNNPVTHLGNWETSEFTSNAGGRVFQDGELRNVGLFLSGEFTHFWIAGDHGVNHYRAAKDFTFVPVDQMTNQNKPEYIGNVAGDFKNGAVSVQPVSIAGARAFVTAVQDVVTETTTFGETAFYQRVKIHKINYTGSGNMLTASTTGVTLEASPVLTSMFHAQPGKQFAITQSFNSKPPSKYYWCSQTFDYFASANGTAAIYCADESTDNGIRLRTYGYSKLLTLTTSTLSDSQTDDPIIGHITYSNGSNSTNTQLNMRPGDDFEKGISTVYPLHEFYSDETPISFTFDIGGDNGWRPQSVALKNALGKTLISWNNSTDFLLDGDCDISVLDNCASRLTVDNNGIGGDETFIGIKAVTGSGGTDSTVMMTLHGANGVDSSSFRLDGPGNDFEAGATDYFLVPTYGADTPLTAITLDIQGDDEWAVKEFHIAYNVRVDHPSISWQYDWGWKANDVQGLSSNQLYLDTDCSYEDKVNIYSAATNDFCIQKATLTPENGISANPRFTTSKYWLRVCTASFSNSGTDSTLYYDVKYRDKNNVVRKTGEFINLDPTDDNETHKCDAIPINFSGNSDINSVIAVKIRNSGTDGWSPLTVKVYEYHNIIFDWNNGSSAIWVDGNATTNTNVNDDGKAATVVFSDGSGQGDVDNANTY